VFSTRSFSQAFNTVLSGTTMTELRSGIYLVDLVARAQADQRRTEKEKVGAPAGV